MTIKQDNRPRDSVPITFFVVGRYPITIGTKLVQPGESVQHVFERSKLPEGWSASELEVSLAAPESGVESRDPHGIVEWAARRR